LVFVQLIKLTNVRMTDARGRPRLAFEALARARRRTLRALPS
jgi:hypothetical protein